MKIDEYTKKISNLGKYIPYLLVGLGFLLLYNIIILWNTASILEEKLAVLEEAAIPLDVQLLVLNAPDCDQCSDISDFVNDLKKLNINIIEEKQQEATEEIINKYQITILPAVILTTTSDGLEKKSDIASILEKTMTKMSNTEFIYQTAIPPYYDVAEKEVKGLVTIISITTPVCDKCLELDAMITALENVLTVEEVIEVEYGTAEATAYIEKYNFENLPTIIISEDAAVYESFSDAWETYGSIEEDGSFVFRNIAPPYLDAVTGRVQGLVDIIYLTDESCTDCYNVAIHKTILSSFGIVIDEETTIDIADAEGQQLLEKYSITKVPTIILSQDASAYTLLTEVWQQVGVIAEDGSYIFTSMEQLQGATYTDLSEKVDEKSEESGTDEVSA